ncbi:MAG: SusC/RagA family TonB-linked outer membrane protein [Gemmatimonadetes bacterium]|nr:SusC/RagA family TonB-linked outer membrane protein [Gemmatimonadota bacterium]
MGMHRKILRLAAGLMVLPGLLAAQARQISGTVTRVGTGAPIPEATVSVVGTTNSARTNAQGQFVVSAPAGEVRLQVRAIGFTRKDAIVPAGNNTVNFTLDQDVFKLDEVVVSGAATTVERRQAATSIGYVSGDDVTKVASASIESALHGKLAGVNIQGNGGAPGGGLQLQIRGTNTILGAFDPLFVVDGVIYSNARILGGRSTIDNGASVLEDDPANRLADLNPADIASIEVLKGAAAAAIYGSKAANGVVVVKTIRGAAGTTRVNVSQRLGTFDLLRRYEPRIYASVAEAADPSTGHGASAGTFLQGRSLEAFNHYEQVWGKKRLSYETVADVSGGTETTKYFMSATWKRDNAIEPGTGFSRQALRVNLDQKVGSKIDISVSSVFNRALHARGWGNNCNNYACFGYALAYIPSFIDLRKQSDGSYINPAIGGGVSSNPLQTAELARNEAETFRFTGGVNFTYNAYTSEKSSFRVVGSGGADLFSQNDDLWSPNELFYEFSQARPGTSIQNNGKNRQMNWNLGAVHTLRTGGIQFTTSGGMQYEDRRLLTTRITTDNLVPGQQNVNQGTNVVAAQTLTPERTFAFYGQEDLSLLDDRLLISGGVRSERSSANGDIGKYFAYPRVSAKYSIRDIIGSGSELKLRAGYGQLGNQPVFGNKFTLLNTPQLGGRNGFAVATTAGDPTIKPERVKEIEGGFDLNFWNGRINIDVTAFRRQTTDLLLSRTPAPSTGFTAQIFNGGQISNKGIETVFGITPIQKSNFNWVSSTSFTLVRSNVDSLPVPAFRPPASGFGGLGVLLIAQGKPLTRVIGPKLNPSGGVVQDDVGDTNPDFRMGFQNSFTYKNLNFSFTVDWQKGGTVTNLTQLLYDDGKTSSDFGTPAYEDRWFPRGFAGQGIITVYIEPADFVKLREVSVNWGLPRSVSEAFGLGVRDVRLGVTGRDLLWSTKYSGLDPEVANFGAAAIRSNVDVTPYPPSRSVFFNVAVSY